MYIDADGVTHYTNAPADSNYRLYIKERTPAAKSFYATDLYDDLIEDASQTHGISFPLLKALIKVESDFDPKAVSQKGALGLMQIMPENIKTLCIEDPFDPRENIMGGARFFKQQLERFNGELQLALAAYNAGPNLVERLNRIPRIKETEDYVRKVMKYFYAFRK